MDITQIPLKINQTNQYQSDQKDLSESESNLNSIFGLLFGQLLSTTDDATTEGEVDNTIDLQHLKEEDWMELDDIMMSLIDGVKELQNLEGLQDLKGVQNLEGIQILKVLQNIEGLQDLKGVQNLEGMQTLKERQNLEDIQALKSLQNLETFQNLKGMQNLQGLQDLVGLQNSKGLQDLKELKNLEGLQELEGLLNVKELQKLVQTASLQNDSHIPDAAEFDQSEMHYVLSLQDDMLDTIKDLEQWLNKAKGLNQTSHLDFNRMIEDLAKFISKHPSKETSNTTLIPDSVKSKIQILMEHFDTDNQEAGIEKKQLVSLDKNQVPLLAKPFIESSVNNDKRTGQVVLPEGREIVPKISDSILMSNQELTQQGNINSTKPMTSTPSVPVSDFAQKTSEWIGKNIMLPGGRVGSTEARFLLNPERLGMVEIKINFEQGQVSTQIVAETLLAKEALEGQIQQLRQNLQQQGLLVQKLEVVLQQVPMVDSSQNQADMMSSGNGSNSSQEQEHQKPQTDENLLNNENDAEQKETSENEQAAFTYGARAATVKAASQIDFTA